MNKQADNGYILERITQSFGSPNPEFANDPRVEEERRRHDKFKDRLIAIHKIRPTSRPLSDILGKEEFEKTQDIWSNKNERNRWSVAFPIIESYEIVGQPKAHDVFSGNVFRKLFQTQSATLRKLDDEARAEIADLEIIPKLAPNSRIAIADEVIMAEGSDISQLIQKNINKDLASALEGFEEEWKGKIRKRAAWVANKFLLLRKRQNHWQCNHCGFHPRNLPNLGTIKPRSCFDVHHVNPLEEGVRYTTVDDFVLLCPTCHRIEHIRLKQK